MVRLLCEILLAKIRRVEAQLGLAKSIVRRERSLSDALRSAAQDYYDHGDHGSRRRLDDALGAYGRDA